MSMKNSTDTIGNRTRDLPACSAVPQPSAPPRALQQAYKQLFINANTDTVMSSASTVHLNGGCSLDVLNSQKHSFAYENNEGQRISCSAMQTNSLRLPQFRYPCPRPRNVLRKGEQSNTDSNHIFHCRTMLPFTFVGLLTL